MMRKSLAAIHFSAASDCENTAIGLNIVCYTNAILNDGPEAGNDGQGTGANDPSLRTKEQIVREESGGLLTFTDHHGESKEMAVNAKGPSGIGNVIDVTLGSLLQQRSLFLDCSNLVKLL